MSSHTVPIDAFVVANGQTASNILVARTQYRDADSFTVFGPAVLAETATLQVSDTEDGSSGWTNYQEGGADVTFAAGKARKIEDPSWRAMRISLSVGAAAQRTFPINKTFFA